MQDYVTQIAGAYRITDSRVSLDSVVYAWRDGLSPEHIKANFPVLTLEEVVLAYLREPGASALPGPEPAVIS